MRTLVFLFAASALLNGAVLRGAEKLQASALQKYVLELINAERVRAGKPRRYQLQSQLLKAAQHHADNMARFQAVEHELAMADLPTLPDRMDRYGYKEENPVEYAVSEIIGGSNYGADQEDAARRIVKGWMESPGHRKSILSTYNSAGVGIATGPENHIYFCVVFGRRI